MIIWSNNYQIINTWFADVHDLTSVNRPSFAPNFKLSQSTQRCRTFDRIMMFLTVRWSLLPGLGQTQGGCGGCAEPQTKPKLSAGKPGGRDQLEHQMRRRLTACQHLEPWYPWYHSFDLWYHRSWYHSFMISYIWYHNTYDIIYDVMIWFHISWVWYHMCYDIIPMNLWYHSLMIS